MTFSTIFVAAVSLFFADPNETVLHDRVDLIELNHHYDDRGWLIMDQVIFYRWSPLHGKYFVRDWRPLKNKSQRPQLDRKRGLYISTWYDGPILRTVSSQHFKETWTQFDPELKDAKTLPKQFRRPLLKAFPSAR